MALTGFSARNLLNNIAGATAMPSGYNRFLALFTTAPSDADTGAVEVAGGSYARVQVGGSDTTSAATASGTTLTFSAVPAWVVTGMTVNDATTSGVIPTATTVVSKTSTTVTISNAVTGGGVLNGDTITFSAFAAASGQGPSTATSSAAVTFAQATASWGTVVAWGIYDASTSGDLLEWDWLGNDPWYPCSITLASPGVITAIGITAGSSPALANGASVALTARFGGALATGLSSETIYTVAGLSADTFNVGVNTSSTGSGMVRQVTQQSIPNNVTASFSSGNVILSAA
jgi:hypothetical protein